MTDITDHLAVIERRVATALARSKRSGDDMLLVAVSKGQPADAVAAAFAAGVRDFGENYAEEAVGKMNAIPNPAIRWHFIGRVQSNKTKTIAAHFDWVHTVDRKRIAVRLDSQRPAARAPLNVLIQVNLAGEAQKGGVDEDGIGRLAADIDALPRLRLRGLMTIPPAGLTAAEAASHFSRVAALASEHSVPGRALDILSMGMSGDFETAIACGSNCIRIGTAIFGERSGRPG